MKKQKQDNLNKSPRAQTSEMDQQEKDKIIKRQLRFQDLLINISTKYINSDLSDIDKLVNESLKQIGEFVECDRSYIFSYDFVNTTTKNTYEWCAEGIEPEIQNLQKLPIDFLPIQWLDAHRKGKAFYVADVSLLPKDGELGLRAILEPQGIKSLITIPKIKNTELIGFIGFDSVSKINKYTENERDILFVFANMLVNVMQRKENEEHINEQEKKKEELLNYLSLQNEELNQYAQAVSHDLRAPLINIHTLMTWYLDDHEKKIEKHDLETLKQVLFNVEKMDLLIKGILEYSTIDTLDSIDKEIDFNVLVNEVLNTILIPENVKISVPKNLPTIFGNKTRFKQIFQNLVQNAIKYNDKEERVVKIGFTEKNNYYEFFVKDNGIGIDPKYFDNIFKVFTKLESTSASSGIGLSIVKKIVTFYQGSLSVESKEGIGTTFYFTLPKT